MIALTLRRDAERTISAKSPRGTPGALSRAMLHRPTLLALARRPAPTPFACALVLTSLLACSSKGDTKRDEAGGVQPPPTTDTLAQAKSSLTRVDLRPDDPSVAVAAKANNDFGVRLFGKLRATSGPGNLLTSPISASLALGMTYGGAKGQTAIEMATALGIPAGSDLAYFAGQNALSAALARRAADAAASVSYEQGTGEDAGATDFALDVASSVWGQTSYPWSPPYLDLLAQTYGAGVYLEDFRAAFEPARLAIDGWVSDRTHGLIPSLLPQGSLDSSTRLVLVNALYLKLSWAHPVYAQATADGAFVRADGTTATARFMSMTPDAYTEDDAAQVAWVDLAGDKLAFFAALPKGDLATYEAQLTSAAPFASPELAPPADVQLALPKLDLQPPAISLAAGLRGLGMVQAFDPGRADLTGMCAAPPDGPLYVSDVLQQATMAVDEKGLTASAAAAVVIDDANAITEPPKVMRVDHPFVVGVVDRATHALLFLGHVTDPTLP